MTLDMLKQEVTSSPSSDELLGNQNDHMTKLWAVAGTAVSEANSLIEQMRKTSSKLPSEGSKNVGGYLAGIDHVTRLIEEVENHRVRVGQLMEAQQLAIEEVKRVQSCERDTQQVSGRTCVCGRTCVWV